MHINYVCIHMIIRWSNSMPTSAVCYNVLRCVLQCVALIVWRVSYTFLTRYCATPCNTLQHTRGWFFLILLEMLFPSVLQHIALFCNVLYSLLSKRNSKVCCSVLQWVAMCYNVLHEILWDDDAACRNVFQCVAMCCSVLQCVAVCCNVRRASFKTCTSNFKSAYTISIQLIHAHTRMPTHTCRLLHTYFPALVLWAGYNA